MICNVKNGSVLLGAEHNTTAGRRHLLRWPGFRKRRRRCGGDVVVLVVVVVEVSVVLFLRAVVIIVVVATFGVVAVVNCGCCRLATAVFTDIPVAFPTPIYRSAKRNVATAHIATKKRMICNVKSGRVVARAVNKRSFRKPDKLVVVAAAAVVVVAANAQAVVD
jgi:hypothetical protein